MSKNTSVNTLTIGDFIFDIYIYPDKVAFNQEFPSTLKAYIYHDNFDYHFALFRDSVGEWKPGGAGNFFLFFLKYFNSYSEVEESTHYFNFFITDKKELRRIEKALLSYLDNEIINNQNIEIVPLNPKDFKYYLQDKRRKSKVQSFFRTSLKSERISIIPQKIRFVNKNTGEIYFRVDYEFKNNPINILNLNKVIFEDFKENFEKLFPEREYTLLNIVDYDKYVFNTEANFLEVILDNIRTPTIYIMGKPESERILQTIFNKIKANEIEKIILQLNLYEYSKIDKNLIASLKRQFADKFFLLITQGEKGVSLNTPENLVAQPYKIKKKEINASGAGDVFGAAFITSFINSDYNLEESLDFAFYSVYEYLRKLNNLNE